MGTPCIDDFAFFNMTVKQGSTLSVKNFDTAPHGIVSIHFSAQIASISPGATGTMSGADTGSIAKGTHPITCAIHGDSMPGTLTIT